jgi:quercetin dioxygenase-like cupin family protein
MSGEFFDHLFTGIVPRRTFLEKVTAAAAALTATPLAAAVGQKQKPQENPNKIGVDVSPQSPGMDLRTEPNPKFSPANIGGGGRVERNFYRRWTKLTKAPMFEGYSVLDARSQDLLPWPEIEGRGLYLNFPGNVHMDAVIYEIPEGKALAARKNFYEQNLICLGGRGYTVVGEGSQRTKCEWAEGTLFTVPMNVVHRHYNATPSRPARLLAITTFPFMVQLFGNLAVIDTLPFEFTDRYDGAPDFFTRSIRTRKRWDTTNRVADIRNVELIEWKERGEGNRSIFWDMAGQTILEPHESEFETGTYKLGHRHPYEAIILTMNGRGFSLYGKDGLKPDQTKKLEWQIGSVVSPPFFWYHQHFNTGPTPARYFAMTEGDFPKRLGIPLEVEQIEADKEDPSIKQRFLQELKRAGIDKIDINDIEHAHAHAHGIPHTHKAHGQEEG